MPWINFPVFSKLHLLISKRMFNAPGLHRVYTVDYLYDGRDMTKQYIENCYIRGTEKPFSYHDMKISSIFSKNGDVRIHSYDAIPADWHKRVAKDLDNEN